MILPSIHSAYRNSPINSAYRNCSPLEMCCSTSQRLRCYKLNNFFSQLTVCNLHQMNSGSKASLKGSAITSGCSETVGLVVYKHYFAMRQALRHREGQVLPGFIHNQPKGPRTSWYTNSCYPRDLPPYKVSRTPDSA